MSIAGNLFTWSLSLGGLRALLMVFLPILEAAIIDIDTPRILLLSIFIFFSELHFLESLLKLHIQLHLSLLLFSVWFSFVFFFQRTRCSCIQHTDLLFCGESKLSIILTLAIKNISLLVMSFLIWSCVNPFKNCSPIASLLSFLGDPDATGASRANPCELLSLSLQTIPPLDRSLLLWWIFPFELFRLLPSFLDLSLLILLDWSFLDLLTRC